MSGRQDLISGVAVPIGQAVMSGLVGALAIAASWQAWQHPTGGAWVFLAVFCDIAALAWTAILLRWLRSEYWLPEPPTAAPAATYPVETIRVLISGPNEAFERGSFLDVPLSHSDLEAVGRVITSGADFSMATLAGRGKPLSRSQFESLRSALMARDLCEWVNPAAHAQGSRLTHAGEALFKHFTTPTPPRGDTQGKTAKTLPVTSARVRASEPGANPMARFSGARILSRVERAARLRQSSAVPLAADDPQKREIR